MSFNSGSLWRAMRGCCLAMVLLSAGVLVWRNGAEWPALATSKAAPAAVVPPTAAALDADDLLVLRFDNSLNGENGETPIQSTGVTFTNGVAGQGVLIDSSDVLKYATAGNFNASAGTVEFWIKPLTNGNDNVARCFFSIGGGELILVKDGANNFRFIFKQDDSEAHQGYNLGSWMANQWHHVAVTWAIPGTMRTYFDGNLAISHSAFAQDLISPVPTELAVGSRNGTQQANAVIDELRISNRARSAQEIASRMLEGLTVSSWSLSPATSNIEMYPGWFYWVPLSINAVTNIGNLSLPLLAATWTSSSPAVAVMDSSGRFKSLAPGTATLTGTLGGQQSSVAINVPAPALPPTEEAIEPFMSTPAAGYLYRMPVVIIRYFPTRDGVNLDAAATGTTTTLAALRTNVERIERRHKFMLEEGSKFRGYSNPAAAPSLGYQVIKTITVYEEVPLGFATGGPGEYFPDYNQILTRFNAEHLVNNLGVKEFWIVQQHHGRVGINESNMSSPTTGDISNSYRTNGDQPIYNKTYVTYGINFTRSQAEATHNHGHQLEAILSHVNQLRDGNTTLWWQLFAKPVMAGANPPARCGNTHFPPNATRDYDYTNLNLVASDIMNWQPSGGPTTMVNANTWGNVPYAWPGGTAPPQEIESKWYIFWFQSMAGRDNTIPYNANKLTNWWQFTGDWDAAIQAGLGLHEPGGCNYNLSVTNQAFDNSGGAGTVSVTGAGGCKWIASSNEPWITITGGRTGNGNGTVTLAVAANVGAPRTGTVAIAGQVFTVTQNSGGLMFYPLARPVRLLDTRAGETACYTPNLPIQGGTARIQSARGLCAGLTIPANAAAITGNITSVQSGGGYLTLYPSDATQPTVAASNYNPNEIVNNVFTVGLSAADGAFKIFALNTSEVVVDVTGYYAPPGPGGLYFHPLPAPVRLLETRAGQPVGCVKPGAPLTGGVDALQTATTACTGIPAAARAIVGNATTVSPQGPGYLTLFPAEAARPLIASSNYDTNQIVNGPFTTGLSAAGQFQVFTLATTELVIDVLGYYSAEANDANGAGLLYTPLARPVRWLETRAGEPVGCYKPGQPLTGNQSYVQTGRGSCAGQTIPASAQAVVGNATVVFPAGSGYLTLWPASAVQPTVATVNYQGGEIVNRHFIVGLGNAEGAFKMFSYATTELVIDLAGYFAP